jgi:hypothetical protein
MTYKPPTSKGTKFGGPNGHATIQINKDQTKVKVILHPEKEDKTGEDKVYLLAMSECPELTQSGEFRVRLDENCEKLLSLVPWEGMCRGKVLKFAAREGEEPAPKTNDKVKFPYVYFTVILKTAEPDKFRGMEIPMMVNYHFEGTVQTISGKEVEIVQYNHPNSRFHQLVEDFCDYAGVWDKGPMQWKANILPGMQKRVLDANKTFQWFMKDGYVSNLFPASLDDEPKEKTDIPEDDFDTTPTKTSVPKDDEEIPWE